MTADNYMEEIEVFRHLTMSDGAIVLSYEMFHSTPNIWTKREKESILKSAVYWIVSPKTYNQLFSEAKHIRDCRGTRFVQICKTFRRQHAQSAPNSDL